MHGEQKIQRKPRQRDGDVDLGFAESCMNVLPSLCRAWDVFLFEVWGFGRAVLVYWSCRGNGPRDHSFEAALFLFIWKWKILCDGEKEILANCETVSILSWFPHFYSRRGLGTGMSWAKRRKEKDSTWRVRSCWTAFYSCTKRPDINAVFLVLLSITSCNCLSNRVSKSMSLRNLKRGRPCCR